MIQSARGVKGGHTEFILTVFKTLVSTTIHQELLTLFGAELYPDRIVTTFYKWKYKTKEEAEQLLSIAILKGLL